MIEENKANIRVYIEESQQKLSLSIHSSVVAWRFPGWGEPGGLLSMGLHKVGHDRSDLAAAAAAAAAEIRFKIGKFSSVAQSCPTLCDPVNRSTPGLPVQNQLPEFTQAHVH